METFDKIFTTLCKPFENIVFTPLYRMLVKKPPHEVSDDERHLMRLSQASAITIIPILIMGPISSILKII